MGSGGYGGGAGRLYGQPLGAGAVSPRSRAGLLGGRGGGGGSRTAAGAAGPGGFGGFGLGRLRRWRRELHSELAVAGRAVAAEVAVVAATQGGAAAEASDTVTRPEARAHVKQQRGELTNDLTSWELASVTSGAPTSTTTSSTLKTQEDQIDQLVRDYTNDISGSQDRGRPDHRQPAAGEGPPDGVQGLRSTSGAARRPRRSHAPPRLTGGRAMPQMPRGSNHPRPKAALRRETASKGRVKSLQTSVDQAVRANESSRRHSMACTPKLARARGQARRGSPPGSGWPMPRSRSRSSVKSIDSFDPDQRHGPAT